MKKSLIIALCFISTFYATHTADKEHAKKLLSQLKADFSLLDELKKDPRFQTPPKKQKGEHRPGFNPFYCRKNF